MKKIDKPLIVVNTIMSMIVLLAIIILLTSSPLEIKAEENGVHRIDEVWKNNEIQITEDLDFHQSVAQFNKKQLIEYQYQKKLGINSNLLDKLNLIYIIVADCEEVLESKEFFSINNIDIDDGNYPITLRQSLDLIIARNLYKDKIQLKLAKELKEQVSKDLGIYRYSEPKFESLNESKYLYSINEMTTGISWMVELTYMDNKFYWSISFDEKTYNKFIGKFNIFNGFRE